MIEIPRAALLANEIAEEAEFFSFGTNDLTQMTFGFSRDDAGKFLGDYYKNKIYESDPFARLDQKAVAAKIEEMEAARTAAAEKAEKEEKAEEGIDIEPKAEISYDDFAKLQFQVGEIIECKEVPKSKKLLCSQVKIGSQVKQIVSGIKQHYSAEEMVGRKVMVLVNLKPATLAGVVSEGMLLCAEDADGNLALMTPEKKMPAGAEIC